jgi:hypothetical protein
MMLAAARIKAEATAQHYPSGDLAFAERIEARVRTKELPSCRTEIGAGRELINREMAPSLVDTVEQPDYVAADASRHRLELWKPARHGEAHSSTGERHGGRASRGRGRHGPGERHRGMIEK